MGQAQSPRALVHLSLRLESQVLKGWGTIVGHSSRIPVFCVTSAPSASGSDQSEPLHRSFLVIVSHGQSLLVQSGWGSQLSKVPSWGGKVGATKAPLGPQFP